LDAGTLIEDSTNQLSGIESVPVHVSKPGFWIKFALKMNIGNIKIVISKEIFFGNIIKSK
jgi:hypothetical protein